MPASNRGLCYDFNMLENLQEEFINRRNLMLEDKIDVSKLFTWFIEQYPKSIEIIKIDSKFQNKFK